MLRRIVINQLLTFSKNKLSNSQMLASSKAGSMNDFFFKLGRATGMAKQAMQKTVAEEHAGIESLPAHGQLSTIVTEKPDGSRILLLKAKGADSTVFVGFDSHQLAALRAHLETIRL
jgi:hypothetical protein